MVVAADAPWSRELRELHERGQGWLAGNAPGLASEAMGIGVMFAHVSQRSVQGMLGGTITAMAGISLVVILVFRSIRGLRHRGRRHDSLPEQLPGGPSEGALPGGGRAPGLQDGRTCAPDDNGGAGGFLVFTTSGFEVSWTLGLLVTITMVALGADFLLRPALLVAMDRSEA